MAWCAYPITYFVYALARGALLDSYPYPFIDVAAIGYNQALLNALGLLVVFVLVGWLFMALAKGVGLIDATFRKSCTHMFLPETPRQPKTASDFDPEVMKLFDQYVHGAIDRRVFSDARGKI